MKKVIIFLPLLFLLSACSGDSPQVVADRHINNLYINQDVGKYVVSKTYQETDFSAIVLSVTCDTQRSGTIPAVEFLITSLDKEDDWQISFGPDIYNPNQELPMIADSSRPSTKEDVAAFSKNLLKQLPLTCQEKYLEQRS